MGFVDVEHLCKFCFRKLGTRLKVGQMIRTIWVTWVTFDGSLGSHLLGQVGLIRKLNCLDVTQIFNT